MTDDSDVTRLVAHIESSIDSELPESPDGWPNEIEAALIDAVFSARATYGGPNTGVRAVVRRWRDERATVTGEAVPLDDLTQIARYADQGGELADILGNHQRVPGNATTKATAVACAAQNFINVGVRHAADIADHEDAARRAYLRVPGLGPITADYFFMLLGRPGVKADVMVQRFVCAALGLDSITPDRARELVTSAAVALDCDLTRLDHAIWLFQRSSG